MTTTPSFPRMDAGTATPVSSRRLAPRAGSLSLWMPLWALGVLALIPVARRAAGAPSAVNQATAKADVTATLSKEGTRVEVALKLPEGTKLNYDAPWKLAFKEGLTLTPASLARNVPLSSFNKETLRFEIPLPGKTDAAKARATRYELVYFLCDAAVTWCKRIKSEGSLSVPAP